MGPPLQQQKAIDWTHLPTNSDLGSLHQEPLQVSNPLLSVPKGLSAFPGWISEEECQEVLGIFDKGVPVWEGFEQRRRVIKFDSNDEDLPACLKLLSQRLTNQIGYTPRQISMEEYPKSQLQKNFSISKTAVTSFESRKACSCNAGCCACFAAVVPIAASVIESINRPKTRSPDCWDLYTIDQHSAGVVLKSRSLYVKTDEFLNEWRTRISALGPSESNSDQNGTSHDARYLVVKFRNVLDDEIEDNDENDPEFSNFGYIPTPEDDLPKRGVAPPLEELLTIIVTTSPIKSNPSTELLERVFETFVHGGREFAYRCRKVIVCDGCREKNGKQKVTNKHANPKQAMRNGIVNTEQLQNYHEFKAALRELCKNAPDESPFSNTHVEELPTRHGYGFALRHALRECVSTPYVIVIQHDRTFMRSCPIQETVNAMWHHPGIKYVGMSMRSNLMYRDIFLGKYGRSFMKEMSQCTLRLPEMVVEADKYGPDSASCNGMDYHGQEKLRENIMALVETYRTSQQNTDHQEWMKYNPLPPNMHQMSLTPTFFWYDNVHICETRHYRDFIFDPRFKMVVKGGFVEDKLSPVIKKTVERLGLMQGHARFGCFLLDDHSGMFFTGHLDGGSYIIKSQRHAKASRN